MDETFDLADHSDTPSILLTGATGKVGQEVLNRLIECGIGVRCLVRNQPEPRPGVDWVTDDLTDATDVAEAPHRHVRFRSLPADLARSRMIADGLPLPLTEALITAAVQRPASYLITDHVRRLTGHSAGTFARWAADHANEFR